MITFEPERKGGMVPNLYRTAIPLRHNPTNMRIVQVLFDMLKMQ